MRRSPNLMILLSFSLLLGTCDEVKEDNTGRNRTDCITNQSNLEVEVARYKSTHPGARIGPTGARLSDPNAHPNAQELMANSSNSEHIRRMLTCPEAGNDGSTPGYHYAYSDDLGHIECAVDNAGLVRAEGADFNHDRFSGVVEE